MRCLNRDSSSLSTFVHRLRPVIRYLILAAILTSQPPLLNARRLNAGNLIMPLIDSYSCHRTELHRTTGDHSSTKWRKAAAPSKHLVTHRPLNFCRYYSASDRGAEYCDERVCLSVCPRSYLRNYTPDLHDFLSLLLRPWFGPLLAV